MNKSKKLIYFCQGDGFNWAIDEDIRNIKEAIRFDTEFTSLEKSEIILSPWPQALHNFKRINKNQKLICIMHGNPLRFFSSSEFSNLFDLVNLWIVRSRGAEKTLKSYGYECIYAPYLANKNTFFKISNKEVLKKAFHKLKRQKEEYLIANFMRDSEGSNLLSPKLVKGADIFLEILTKLKKKNLPIKAVLAGPRRHWIIRKLRERNINFYYHGKIVEVDDLKINIVTRDIINQLYNFVDLNLITSRSEGGPQSILEGLSADCKTLSSNVGMANEILTKDAIFNSIDEAVKKIEKDIRYNYLERHKKISKEIISKNFNEENLKKRILNGIKSIESFKIIKVEKKNQNDSNLIKYLKRIFTTKVSFINTNEGKYKKLDFIKEISKTKKVKIEEDIYKSDILFCNYNEIMSYKDKIKYQKIILLVDSLEPNKQIKIFISTMNNIYKKFYIYKTVFNSDKLLKKISVHNFKLRHPLYFNPTKIKSNELQRFTNTTLNLENEYEKKSRMYNVWGKIINEFI